MSHIAFLFGSGISWKSGAPMTPDITEALLNRGWREDGPYRFAPSDVASSGAAGRAQEFLQLLRNYVDPHLNLREKRSSHYEDLYAAVVQLFQDEFGEIVNPMLSGSEGLIREIASHLYQKDAGAHDPNSFMSLAYNASILIHWVVFHMLKEAHAPVGIEVLTAVAKECKEVDIFTLNHDLLVERQFTQTGIQFTDGFAEIRGDVVRFNWSWKDKSISTRLYKLHGSLDWYRLEFENKEVQFAKVPLDLNPGKCKDANGTSLPLRSVIPLFLTGTTGKDRLYGVGLVGEFFSEFRSRLAGHHTLICCGYGWADIGINNRVNQWLCDSRNNRLVILHNGPVADVKTRPFWSRSCTWDQFESLGKITVITKWLSECAVEDLNPFFDE